MHSMLRQRYGRHDEQRQQIPPPLDLKAHHGAEEGSQAFRPPTDSSDYQGGQQQEEQGRDDQYEVGVEFDAVDRASDHGDEGHGLTEGIENYQERDQRVAAHEASYTLTP
jgi:hypothetical protein